MTVTVCTVDEFRALPPGRRRYPSELCLLAEPAPYAWLERDCLMPVSQRYGTVLASYGYLHMSDGRFVDAHRGMWERRHGPIPDGLWVLHRCDNPPCCEDSHLYLGTALDNMRDVSERGRSRPPFGEMSGAAKLTSDDDADDPPGTRRAWLPPVDRPDDSPRRRARGQREHHQRCMARRYVEARHVASGGSCQLGFAEDRVRCPRPPGGVDRFPPEPVRPVPPIVRTLGARDGPIRRSERRTGTAEGTPGLAQPVAHPHELRRPVLPSQPSPGPSDSRADDPVRRRERRAIAHLRHGPSTGQALQSRFASACDSPRAGRESPPDPRHAAWRRHLACEAGGSSPDPPCDRRVQSGFHRHGRPAQRRRRRVSPGRCRWRRRGVHQIDVPVVGLIERERRARRRVRPSRRGVRASTSSARSASSFGSLPAAHPPVVGDWPPAAVSAWLSCSTSTPDPSLTGCR